MSVDIAYGRTNESGQPSPGMRTGMLSLALRRANNIQCQTLEVNKAARRTLNGHGSSVAWLTGLSGAGKSTVASLLENRLDAVGSDPTGLMATTSAMG